MADDNTESFRLDLDAKDFIENAQKAFESISQIGGQSESVGALVGTLGEVAAAGGVIAAAFVAAKSVMAEIFEAENIKAAQKQFDILAEQAGAYGENLKRGLVEAGQGWATETELMQAASKAMLNLEIDVNQLPKVMNVAREAAAVMGGTMIEKFEAISRSIEFGSTRFLRHIGIVIDQKKAYDDFAKSLGTTADQLTTAGKQQALLNAVVDYGKAHLEEASKGIRENITLWQQLKTTFKEVGEAIALVFDKFLGPILNRTLQSLQFAATGFKNFFVGQFGDAAEKTKVHVEEMKQSLQQLQYWVDVYNEKKLKGTFTPEDAARLKIINEQIALLNTELGKNVVAEKQAGDAAKARIADENDGTQRAKFVKDKEKEASLEVLTQKELHDRIIKMRQEELEKTDNVYKQMTITAQQNAQKQADAFKKAGGLGGTAMSGFQNHSIEAFKAIGDGSKTASEAVKDAFLQTLGDMAMQQGIFMMLDAFKTFPFVNIPEFAAGGALVALGGALGGMGSAASAPSASGGSGNSGQGTNTPSANPSQAATDNSGNGPKNVNLIIQGHMMTDDRTARWIVDQVRAASDATDFTIRSTSGGFS